MVSKSARQKNKHAGSSVAMHLGLNMPGFLYLNEQVLASVRSATGDEGKGTVDELKLVPLYDTMSELLFPWCSTLTSRARYFFFAYAVLQLALEETIPRHMVNPNYTTHECHLLARKYLRDFVRHVRRIEKCLALALCIKREEDGAFGQVKVNRWLQDGRNPVNAKSYSMILSLDGRYPNAIYRAGSRRLGLFTASSKNTALIAAQLKGEQPFQNEWMVAGNRALAEVRMITEFWEQYETDGVTALSVARTRFEKSSTAKNFGGFAMQDAEADFLYGRIQEATAYWRHVKPKELHDLFSSAVEFSDLQSAFVGVQEEVYFLAAGHIDTATKYFRHYYAEIVRHGGTPPLDTIRTPLTDIEKSVTWLDRVAKTNVTHAGWENVWLHTYSGLIHHWLSIAKSGSAERLANELKARAEKVVRDRGRGKLAPHCRQAESRDNDINEELGVRATSFRLGNAERILKDISRAIPRG